MESQLDFEAELQREMVGSDDFAEGVTAFAEKRAPRSPAAEPLLWRRVAGCATWPP
jgi:hypothetical protein